MGLCFPFALDKPLPLYCNIPFRGFFLSGFLGCPERVCLGIGHGIAKWFGKELEDYPQGLPWKALQATLRHLCVGGCLWHCTGLHQLIISALLYFQVHKSQATHPNKVLNHILMPAEVRLCKPTCSG